MSPTSRKTSRSQALKPSPDRTRSARTERASTTKAPDTAALREAKDRAAELLADGELEAALTAFQELVKAAPHEPMHRQKVADVLQRLGRKSEAIAAYQEAAEAWARTGWLLRAIALCKVILQLDAGHSSTQAMLAELYARHSQATPPGSEAPPQTAAMAVKPAKASAPAPVLALPPGKPVSLFSALDREEFLEVLSKLERKLFQPGQQIVREGEPGASMFIIVEGSVEVLRQLEGGKSKKVAKLGEGEFFGEMALVAEEPRMASVVAAEPTVLLELSREQLAEVVSHHPPLGEVVQQFYRERLLANVMHSNPLFSKLPEALQQLLQAAFKPLTVQKGEQILTRGQPAQALYLLLRGRCEVFHEHVDGRETSYPEMVEGDVFGEIALLRSKLVTATVRASTPCTLLMLEREVLEQLISQHPDLRQRLERMGSERLQRTTRLLSGRALHPGDTRV